MAAYWTPERRAEQAEKLNALRASSPEWEKNRQDSIRQMRGIGDEAKRCTKCEVEKALSEFYIRKRGRSAGKPRSSCKSCEKAIQNAKNAENREANATRSRAYFAAHREERRLYCAQWYARNKEYTKQYYLDNRERIQKRTVPYCRQRRANRTKEQRQEFYRKYKHHFIEHGRRRRALLRNVAVEKFTIEDVIARDGLICYLCRRELDRSKVTLDHFIPIARGGPHSLVNARVACRPCNSKKWAHLPHEIGLDPYPHLFAL